MLCLYHNMAHSFYIHNSSAHVASVFISKVSKNKIRKQPATHTSPFGAFHVLAAQSCEACRYFLSRRAYALMHNHACALLPF